MSSCTCYLQPEASTWQLACTLLMLYVCCSGFDMRCPDGKHRQFVPVIAAYVADIKEANEVFNVAPFPSPCPDINTLVSTKDMNDPEHQAELRTEIAMFEVHRCHMYVVDKYVCMKIVYVYTDIYRYSCCAYHCTAMQFRMNVPRSFTPACMCTHQLA